MGPPLLRGAADWAWWVSLTTLVAVEKVLLHGFADAWWQVLLLAAAFAVVVATRATRPLVGLAVAGAATVVELTRPGSDEPMGAVFLGALLLAAYSAGRHPSSSRGFAAVVTAGVLGLGAVRVLDRGDDAVTVVVMTWLFDALAAVLLVVLPWLVGRYRAQHAQLVLAGWERASRTEAEQQMALEQARLRERTRIAQDMHDSIGHELSLIALRAGALEVDRELASRHRQAAGELRAAAAEATSRLGEVVGVLRADRSDAPVQPVGEGVAEVVERAAASGLDVELDVRGTAARLPSMTGLAARRVVQEALTNAAKHAPGAAVRVVVEHTPDELRIRVSDDGGSGAPYLAPASGHGLDGLDERVRLAGGTLRHGRTPRGFEVGAVLPLAGGTALPAAPARAGGPAAELAAAQRRVRRELVTAAATLASLGALLGLVIVAYYFVVGSNAVLDGEEVDEIRIGQHREEIDDQLPDQQTLDPPTENAPPEPAGADCEFYSSDEPLAGTYVVRLCFVDDVLVSKDRIQQGSTPMEDDP
jgi:signal transduction histidine kinase